MKLLVLQLLLVVSMARSITICSGVSEEDEEFILDLSQEVLACSRFLSCLLERLCNSNAQIVKEEGSSSGKLKLPSRRSRHASANKELEASSPRRSRRQLVKTCCVEPCTINDMLQYCTSYSRNDDVAEEDT